MTKEHNEAEQTFVQTTTKNHEGRFVVRLPWKRNSSELGNSRNQALSRFFSLEKKLEENPSFREQYNKCIHDWEKLGHMKKVEENLTDHAYYIPHHAVIKETSTSTKLRVVFDASMKTTNGTSLNDLLIVGPVVQPELISTLMRFRMKPFAISADITKMYRQILVHPEDTRFQRIFWRNSPDEQLSTYELLTVAFGTSSAPYLATRCIKELGLEVKDTHPIASSALLNDFYVDDCLTGGNSIQEVQLLREQLTEILMRAGFPLTKWCASHPELLNDVPLQSQETEFPFSSDGEPTIKTLGIFWRPGEDVLQFYFRPKEISAVTKREILAVIAAIYDPLGFVGPVVTTAKILMQNIWKIMTADKKSSWDEQLPKNLLSAWSLLAKELPHLKNVKIPRYYFICKPTAIELHGFCDASEKAYGAVIYIRGVPAVAQNIKLVISKSRVASLKQQTIPRLELCGALLLAQLACKVKDMLQLQYEISLSRLWCDSTIALSWIHTSSYKLEQFIANRVQKIQNLSKDAIWDHVDSKFNPADCLSRGLTPQELLDCKLWWNGPNWLSENVDPWSTQSNFNFDSNLKLGFKKNELPQTLTVIERNDIFLRYSQLSKLIRVTAYILRFSKGKGRLIGPLQLCELNRAKITLIKLAQKENFSSEIKQLQTVESTKILSKSSLSSLSPFLDKEGVLRVGGRLEFADISFEQKHPIILDSKHPLTELIVRYEHLTHLHAGPRLLKSVLRRNYWIVRHHNVIQKCIKRCLKCIQMQAKIVQQSMASLPRNRVVPSRPFDITGVDFTGPVMVKCYGSRRPIFFKTYIAIFICFSTKAVHFEIVGNLSSLAFISALTRFISRRGKPSEIHSDNGSTFTGTKSLLDKQLRQFLQENSEKIIDFSCKQGISWHFIPAYTPHWGGLWESNLKSMKSHLKKSISISNSLNFDEVLTLLTQIEAILNSRPLTPESNDPNDINALTPGHFLIGGPLTALPNSDFKSKTDSQLKHWKLIRNQVNQFWKRWSNDYLNTLHQRTKWKIVKSDLKIGDFVLIKEKDLPPLNWCMGRISEIFPGKDHLVRLVEVRTNNGVLTRSISNLVYLPINE